MSGRWERPRWPICTTAILKTRPVAYTTVMTVMKKLARKGFLHCDPGLFMNLRVEGKVGG